ncbi:MAG: hypothetical protein J5821_03235, partial [Alphaproteobacteria bacterium]|nr:hypothetical protein [Alphaproteobacteria bacterium]
QAWEAYALPLSYTRNIQECIITKMSFQVICFFVYGAGMCENRNAIVNILLKFIIYYCKL